MSPNEIRSTARLIADHEQQIVSQWMSALRGTSAVQAGRIREGELQTQCQSLLQALREAIAAAGITVANPAYDTVRDILGTISRARALQGFSTTETATFVLSLKQPLAETLSKSGEGSHASAWALNTLIDELALYTMDVYQKSRDEVIIRQQREISELSTPVVKLWEGVLALPVIGTLDSERTQVVMENLLQAIVDEEASIAIIDITGVPTVDTLTAQYLIKTVAAARLMGADCIISGIRPQIAQTIVHLGVELNVTTKATLADAFALALRRIGRAVVRTKAETSAGAMRGME
jgi:rsbT co-antagonist protein RsbR